MDQVLPSILNTGKYTVDDKECLKILDEKIKSCDKDKLSENNIKDNVSVRDNKIYHYKYLKYKSKYMDLKFRYYK